MTKLVALLRGINVGGHKMVSMSDLRDLVTKLGFTDAKTLLQSGNLVFASAGRTSDSLERLLEAETSKRLKISPDYLVRTAKEWHQAIAANPFPNEAQRDPSHLLVVFLKNAVQAKDVQALQAAIRGRETVRAVGKQLYVVYPDGIGRSKLTLTLIEQKLATRGTGRNWNTVLKLAALIQESV